MWLPLKKNAMENKVEFDVIIIGGSYAGLSAAMTLGRSLKQVLIVDSQEPCNKQTPHSHNFITQDGEKPSEIAAKARLQVLAYPTVKMHSGLVVDLKGVTTDFIVKTEAGETFKAKKILFATGIVDQMLPVKGFGDCWGVSILHCPYCHGYEVRNKSLAVLANGDPGFDFSLFIHNWSEKLILLTNGKSTLRPEQIAKLKSKDIAIVETEISEFIQVHGQLQSVVFADGRQIALDAIFARVGFKQHSELPAQLGCTITEQGFIQTDEFQATSIPGVYAAGDNCSPFRSVSGAAAAGTKAGAFLNKELIDEFT
jgi:thioredoxin reductase